MRTVLSPLGLNIHAQPTTTAPVLAVAAQGAALTVRSFRATGGGWYQVQGESVTGWIVADPSLSAPGAFTAFSSADFNFAVLYPADWTFAQESGGVVFRPQHGAQTVVVRNATSESAFSVPSGYVESFTQQEIVCGYTAQLNEFVLATDVATPSPLLGGVQMLQRFADLRLRFDAHHAMDLSYDYSAPSDLGIFADFYNSLTVPYPLCEQPASPSPT